MWKLLKEINESATDTLDVLDQAAEKDEVDTVTFGLETDDGNIVKVYVQADQADEFEKELSKAFGKHDNIEEVLNELAKTFNVVDVIWPDEDKDAQPDEIDNEDEAEVSDGSESQTEFADEVADADAAKKKIKKESVGSRFAAKYLGEASAEAKQTTVPNGGKIDGEEDEESLVDETNIRFTNIQQKLVYDLLQLLGVEAGFIKQRRPIYLKIIRSSALKLQKDSRMRNLLNRLRSELESAGGLREDVINETSIDEQLTTTYAKRILTVLRFLGMTDDAFKYHQVWLRKNIRLLAVRMNQAPRVRYLINQVVSRITDEEIVDEDEPKVDGKDGKK